MHIPRPKEFIWLPVPYIWDNQIYTGLTIIQINHISEQGLFLRRNIFQTTLGGCQCECGMVLGRAPGFLQKNITP